MRLYLLGELPWADTQLVYHALAELGREGLVLCWPATPYLCLGFHQDARQELDLARCRAAGLPIFRRETGGGLVLLDGGQVFWQVVLGRRNPLIPLRRDRFYAKFLAPVAAAYAELGVAAELVPPNDLRAPGGKICGTGAGEIGEGVAFVGNLMRNFDPGPLAAVVAAPHPRFRERYREAMAREVSSLVKERGEAMGDIPREELAALLARHFAALLGPLPPAGLDDELKAAMAALAGRMLAPGHLYFARKPRPVRRLKVRAGVFLCHGRGEAPGGGVEASWLEDEGRLGGIEPTGPGAAEVAGLAGLTPAEAGPALGGLLAREPALAGAWREALGLA